MLVLSHPTHGLWESAYLGTGGCTELADLPSGWTDGDEYRWWVRAYLYSDPDANLYNNGSSYSARRTTIRRPGSPGAQGINGVVTKSGTPAVGLILNLVHAAGGNYTDRGRVATDALGKYSFTGAPSLGPGEEYVVTYDNSIGMNNPGPDSLWDWYGNQITTYSAGSTAPGGDFDVIDVPLSFPPNESAVTLPASFCWSPRSMADDNYQFEIYDPVEDRYASTDYLGRVSCAEITSIPPGWPSGRRYLWSVVVYKGNDPDNTPYNYGNSQTARYARLYFAVDSTSGSESGESMHEALGWRTTGWPLRPSKLPSFERLQLPRIISGLDFTAQ
jgi:hypothetical protein